MSAAVSRRTIFAARSECEHVPTSAKGIAYCASCGEVLLREVDDDREIVIREALVMAETVLEFARRWHSAARDEVNAALAEIEGAQERAEAARDGLEAASDALEAAAHLVEEARALRAS